MISHPFPVCLCKSRQTADITEMQDACRVHLCLSCSGIRFEGQP